MGIDVGVGRFRTVLSGQSLSELNATAGEPQRKNATQHSRADTIYRPFFVAGVATVLSLGCLWGAVNLFLIGASRSSGGVDYSWVLAHGHAMLFGFVAFFIMGFAYQAFPRFKQVPLWKPGLAISTLPLMAVGVGLQAVAHVIAPRSPFLPLGIAAGLLQLVGVAVFTLVIAQTFRRAARRDSYDGFVYAALGWFNLAAALNPVIFWLFETAGTKEQFLFRVATFNIPYRDIQLLGVVLIMILGVSLRFLPHAYGLREPSALWRGFLLWGVNAAVTVGIASFLIGMLTGNHRILAVGQVAALILVVAAIGTPRQYRLFGSVPESGRDRGLKFIRAAHIWLIMATLMLAFMPIYIFGVYLPLTGTETPFSHAFFSAFRHALTVGFVMMMIVGVSSRLVPTLSGVNLRQANPLTATFVLLNVGNAMRISTQIATDFTPLAYPLMGMSGFIEVLGLGLWGYDLIKNVRIGIRIERESARIRRDGQPQPLGCVSGYGWRGESRSDALA